MEPGQKQWFAVYCKPRQERVAYCNLDRQGFSCFLPEALNPYQRLSKSAQPRIEPLFPRYLFLQASPEVENLAVVRSTRGVVGLVRSGFELIQVPDAVIQMIRQRQDTETGLISLDPIPVRPGDQVEVFDGPFAGMRGILEQRAGEQRSFILIELLGRQSRVKVDSLLLKRTG